jgi:hypothetical protein
MVRFAWGDCVNDLLSLVLIVLLDGLLDPEVRITAKDALEHEYFKSIVRFARARCGGRGENKLLTIFPYV